MNVFQNNIAKEIDDAEARRVIEAARAAEARVRAEAQRKAEAEATAKREADEKLRKRIRAEISADLHQCEGDGSSLWDEGESPLIDGIVTAIMDGKVRHVKVIF